MLKRRARSQADPVPTTSVPATSACDSTSDQDNTNVKVVVRVRPENQAEIKTNFSTVVKVLDDHLLVFDPKDDSLPRFERVEAGRFRRPMLTRKRKDLRFAFDCVFDENSTQMEVFENTTKAILDGILDGINCSVFAYGATGAGKTYTMLGSEDQPGVMFLTMMELYRRIEAIKDEKTCEVAVSYLEVYNEVIHDLLLPSRQLTLREDSQKGVVVSGLSQHQPKSAEELLQMLKAGNKNRKQHPTEANATSSRSHAVFQVFVHQKARTAGLSAEVTKAKMSLIDLAGSERATVTSNRGARLREGANINKSLLALGNCINALAANKGKAVHIPYRNSKLTRLLKDSLGGNCRTVMIANISPSGHSYEDTYNTLKYADRAKQIKAKLVRNVVNVDFHVSRYKVIVTELRKEVDELKQKILEREVPVAPSFDLTETTRFQGMLQDVYSRRAQLKREMADLDASERDILLRTFRKERDLHRIEVLTANGHRLAKVHAKVDFLQQRLKDVRDQKERTQRDLVRNSEAIAEVQREVEAALGSSESATALHSHMEVVMEARKMEAEGLHQWKQTKHLLKYIKNQEKDISRTEKLFTFSLELIHEQHKLLLGSNGLSSTLKGMYDQLVRMTEGDKEVIWADQSSSDEVHDVSVSSFSQSQQTLFDTIVSNSSPLKKVVTNDTRRFSSPSVSASLGILTSTASVQPVPDQGNPVIQAPSPYLIPTSHGVTCHPLTTRLLAERQVPTVAAPKVSMVPEHLTSNRLRTIKELAQKSFSSPGTGPKRHREVTILPTDPAQKSVPPSPGIGPKRRREIAPPCILLTEDSQKRGEKRPRTPEHSHSVPASPLGPLTNSSPPPRSGERSIQVLPTSHLACQRQASADSTDGGGKYIKTSRGKLNLSELTSISSPFYPSVDTAALTPVCQGFEDNFVSPHRPPATFAPGVQQPCVRVPLPRPRSSEALSRAISSPAVISLGGGASCRTTVVSVGTSPATAFKRVAVLSPSPHHHLPVAMATGSASPVSLNTSPVPMETRQSTTVTSSTHLFVPVVSPAVPSPPPPPVLVVPAPKHPHISHPARQPAFSRPAFQSREIPLLAPRAPLLPPKIPPRPDTLAQQRQGSATQLPSSTSQSEEQLNTTFTVSVASPPPHTTTSEESSSAVNSQTGQALGGNSGAGQPLPSAFKPLQCSTNSSVHNRQRVANTSGEISRKIPGYRSLTKSAANKRVVHQTGQTRVTQKENQSQQLLVRSSGKRQNFTRSASCRSSKSQLTVH